MTEKDPVSRLRLKPAIEFTCLRGGLQIRQRPRNHLRRRRDSGEYEGLHPIR